MRTEPPGDGEGDGDLNTRWQTGSQVEVGSGAGRVLDQERRQRTVSDAHRLTVSSSQRVQGSSKVFVGDT